MTHQARNLSEAELGALLWTIQPTGGTENADYCHMLGMGKPFGMGVVKLMPSLYLIDRTKRYGKLFDEQGWELGVVEASPRVFIEQFKAYMAQELELTPGSFWDHTRVKMLLSMMDWNTAQSRLGDRQHQYMDLERDAPRYREHFVLPDALNVNRQASFTNPIPPQPQQVAPVSMPPMPKLSKTVPGVGDTVKGKLQDYTANKYIFLTVDGYSDLVEGYISPEEVVKAGKNYSNGFPSNSIKLIVQEVTQNGDRWMVVCQFVLHDKK